MKLGTKFSLTTIGIVVSVCLLLGLLGLFVFGGKLRSLDRDLFAEKVDRLVLLAYEQNELFYEGVFSDEQIGQGRVIDKLRINYREQKDSAIFAFIVDAHGRVILHPEEEQGKQLFDENASQFMMTQKDGEIEYSRSGVRNWCVFEVYKPWNWIFCMTTSVQNRDRAINSFKWITLAVTVGMILLSILMVLFLSRKYIQPINRVIHMIQAIARGKVNLSQEMNIQADTNDEVGMLGIAVGKMAEDLSIARKKERELLAATAAAAEAEKQRAAELDAVNQQLKASEQQLQAGNQQLRASEQQLKAANQQLEAKEQALSKSREELKSKLSDVERFNKVMIGRELEMVKLKEEVNVLHAELGREIKYKVVEKMNR